MTTRVQRGTASIGAGEASATVAIAAVDPGRSALWLSFQAAEDGGPAGCLVSGQLTNATTLTFTRAAAAGSAVSVSWEVVEWSPGAVVQRGSVAMAGTAQTVAVTAVDPGKAFLLYTLRSADATWAPTSFVSGRLASGSQIVFETGVAGSSATVEWQLVRYEGCTVQHGSLTVASGASSGEAAIAAVDPAKTLLLPCWRHPSALAPSAGSLTAGLPSATTVRFSRFSSGAAVPCQFQAVSFTDGTRVQAGETFAAIGTPGATMSFAAVALDRSVVGRGCYGALGSGADVSGGGYAHTLWSASLAAPASLSLQRAATGGASSVGWSVIEFPVGSSSATRLAGLDAAVLRPNRAVTGALDARLAPGSRVQRGSATIAANTASATVAIPAVDPARALVLATARSAGAGTPRGDLFTAQIADATTLVFRREATPGTAIDIQWEVVSFPAGVRVQRGAASFDGTTALTVPIETVTAAKAFVVLTSRQNGFDYLANSFVRARLPLAGGGTATSLVLDLGSASSAHTVEWQVVEHQGASVQGGTLAMASGAVTATATLPQAVDPAKAWLVYTYYVSGTGTPNQFAIRGQLTDGTTLTFDRYASGLSAEIAWRVVEFADGTRVQRGNAALANGAQSATAAIAAVDPTRAILAGGYRNTFGRVDRSDADNLYTGSGTLVFNSPTQIGIARQSAAGPCDLPWQAIEFVSPIANTAATALDGEIRRLGTAGVSLGLDAVVRRPDRQAAALLDAEVGRSDLLVHDFDMISIGKGGAEAPGFEESGPAPDPDPTGGTLTAHLSAILSSQSRFRSAGLDALVSGGGPGRTVGLDARLFKQPRTPPRRIKDPRPGRGLATSDPAAGALVSEVYRPAILVMLDYASGFLRAASTPFDIVWNGVSWLGVGNLGGISVIEESLELKAAGVQLQLSGIPVEHLSIALGEHYQGRAAFIYQVLLDEEHRVLGDPLLLFRGRMDTQDIELGETATVTLVLQSRLADWERPRIRRFTNEDQQAVHPGDRFFEFVPQMVEKTISWGKS